MIKISEHWTVKNGPATSIVSSPIFHGVIRRVIGPCLRPLASSARRRARLSGVVRKQRHAGARVMKGGCESCAKRISYS
jgi:hypothetical protein